MHIYLDSHHQYGTLISRGGEKVKVKAVPTREFSLGKLLHCVAYRHMYILNAYINKAAIV